MLTNRADEVTKVVDCVVGTVDDFGRMFEDSFVKETESLIGYASGKSGLA